MRATLPPQIDNHELIRIIGSGSYGDVVLGRNKLTGAYRAVKIVWRDAFKDERPYQRELAAIRCFEPISRSHPGFVQILHVGELPNAFYYIMELADGEQPGPLQPDEYSPRLLTRKEPGPLPVHECISIGVHLAAALSVPHKHGLIHRDIKPSNIIFVGGKPKLADIGLVTQIAEANSFVGTTGFVPPEGPVSPASDVYSLGKVLYEISTGKDRCEFPELPANISSENSLYLELNQVVLKACDHRADRRYPSAEAMLKELELLETGASVKRLRVAERRLRRVTAAFVLLLLVGGAFAVGKNFRDHAAAAAQRRVSYIVTRGNDYFRGGDFASALPFFVAAGLEDPGNLRTHQLRVGAATAFGAKRVGLWRGPLGALSRNGKWAVTATPHNFELRDARTGLIHKSFPVPKRPSFYSAGFDGSRFGYALDNRVVIFQDGGRTHISFEFPQKADAFAFSPAAPEIAVFMTNSVAFVNCQTGSREVLQNRENQIYDGDYSPDGGRIAFFRADGTEVWSRSELQRVSVRFRHSMPYAALFHPKRADRLLSAGFDKAAYFDLNTGDVLTQQLQHEFGVYTLAFSPDLSVVASGGFDNLVRLSDPFTLVARSDNSALYHPDRLLDLAFADPKTLVTLCYDGTYHVWDLAPQRPEPQLIQWQPAPDSRRAELGAMRLEASDRVLDIYRNSALLGRLSFSNRISSVAIAPSARQFAVATHEQEDLYPHAGRIYEFSDLSNPLLRLQHHDGVNFIQYSPSGKMIVTCSEDHTAIIWDSTSGAPITPALKHERQVYSAAFSKDEAWVVTASLDATVRVWEVRTGDPITPPFKFHTAIGWVGLTDEDRVIEAVSLYGNKRFRLPLPIADRPLAEYRDALPAPKRLIVSPAGF